MGWPDIKIRKTLALVGAALWGVLAAFWFLRWHGRIPMSGWYLSDMAAVELVALWRAFRVKHSDA